MIRKMMTVWGMAFLILAGSGCLFASYTPVSDFELDLKPIPADGRICVAAMRNTSSSGMRIQSRSCNELKRDPYNVWSIEPGLLVTAALNKLLCRDGVAPSIVFQGEIDCFEADIPKKVFRLSGFCFNRKDRKKIRFDIQSPLHGSTPGNIASAASEAVRRLALRLAESVK